ncbi:flavodoxin domain-containing protein [Neobacillus kokaensis]|uniref:Flavodoxin-1 n=1 Tax=Neobacillus kokaensis TaxID=2759023 RepID=A0ABQ3N603_9BACI|nr:flavodoxin domain-containing protein [Neobacillus kokaensis]GHH99022.1 putative flavodoxin-1 [Neobacillus kokaensis]
MRIAIVYSTKTGNTEEVVQLLQQLFLKEKIEVNCFLAGQFPTLCLANYDAIVIGTYTWGNGEIPREMQAIYNLFEIEDAKDLVTGVVGTGDTCYPKFCGAVDHFRDMLFVQTNLAATLKIELVPQLVDYDRCNRFVEIILERIKSNQYR